MGRGYNDSQMLEHHHCIALIYSRHILPTEKVFYDRILVHPSIPKYSTGAVRENAWSLQLAAHAFLPLHVCLSVCLYLGCINNTHYTL